MYAFLCPCEKQAKIHQHSHNTSMSPKKQKKKHLSVTSTNHTEPFFVRGRLLPWREEVSEFDLCYHSSFGPAAVISNERKKYVFLTELIYPYVYE